MSENEIVQVLLFGKKKYLMVCVKLIVVFLGNITSMCEIAREKCYYLKIIGFFREMIN